MKAYASPLILGIGLCAVLTGLSVQAKTGGEAETAELLIVLLRAGRTAVSEYQALINNASKSDKGFTEDFVEQQILERFKAETRVDLSRGSSLPRGEILRAMEQAEREVVRDAQPVINKRGVGVKGFVPSVFARKAAQKSLAKTGITMKLTALDYRFPGNHPDDFEAEALRVFAESGYPKGQPYAKVMVVDGGPAMRVMEPEYADAACLICHGDPKKDGRKEISLGRSVWSFRCADLTRRFSGM